MVFAEMNLKSMVKKKRIQKMSLDCTHLNESGEFPILPPRHLAQRGQQLPLVSPEHIQIDRFKNKITNKN